VTTQARSSVRRYVDRKGMEQGPYRGHRRSCCTRGRGASRPAVPAQRLHKHHRMVAQHRLRGGTHRDGRLPVSRWPAYRLRVEGRRTDPHFPPLHRASPPSISAIGKLNRRLDISRAGQPRRSVSMADVRGAHASKVARTRCYRRSCRALVVACSRPARRRRNDLHTRAPADEAPLPRLSI